MSINTKENILITIVIAYVTISLALLSFLVVQNVKTLGYSKGDTELLKCYSRVLYHLSTSK